MTCSLIYGQETKVPLKGKITFITSKNVYVKFDNTAMIKVGDTLKTIDNVPCLLVNNKSSNSVVSVKIGDCVIEKGMIVTYLIKSIKERVIEEEAVVENIGISYNDSIKAISKNSKKTYSEDIRARLSASSYSTVSEVRDDRHRLMTRLSINANHINHSNFSVDTYLNYRYNINSSETNSLSNDNYLRVFNLAVRYDVDSTLSITAGRKINYKISSLGAIDGLQAEKFFGKNYVGAIAGFRPDIFDYGFNPDLLQYGAYVGRLTDSENLHSQTTLGIAEQRNNSDLDRRFTYFQHSSTINKKLNLFATAELDIFNKVNDSISNSPRLTNLYVSARYRFNRKVNLALSYDSRKRIIYYKTYETDIEEILDEDIARQGIRARINIKPFKSVFTGFSYSKRFQSNSQNKSDNIYGFVSFSNLPIDGRMSLTYNMNSSNYLDSNIASLRYSRQFMDDRLNADFYYRFVNYKYTTNVPEFSQHYVGTYLSYYLDRSLIISLSGEYSTYNQEDNFRINTRIIKRFFRKRKK
ncbi:hypothetical protein GCM10023314_19260 [Algibacter agarivorans]|uniref:Outer membrane protein beta-barrel domain-containing protein n=2 Tax=Algibacter agarivorans TaxID=1109741 RepID=A0ABP9GJZ8_9FLAO